MRNVSAAGIGFALMAALSLGAVATQAATDDGLAKRLETVLKTGHGLQAVRIEVTDAEEDNPKQLTVYGSGVGVWDGTLQFPVTEKQVRKALKVLKRSGFLSMPDRVKGPKPPHAEEGGEPDSTMLVRVVTLDIGGLTKTVVQDNKAYPLEAFRELRDDLVRIFRKAAKAGIGAKSLDDALAKLAAGTLAPEVLRVTVNAPQQRALPSQDGQGWLLRIRDGRIEVLPHTVSGGFGSEVQRPLTPELAHKIATWLREADFSSLPPNVYDAGYTDMTVEVLQREKTLQAREFAGRDPAAEADRRQRFRTLRGHFFELAMSILKG